MVQKARITVKKQKNDGTDPKKNDGNPEAVGATQRVCYMTLTNNLGSAITNLSFTHTSGDKDDVISLDELGAGETSYQETVHYETGWWADYDYWNISFTMDDTQYSTPYNDRCNLEYKDEGSTLACSVNPGSKWDTTGNMYLDVPMISDGCAFGITKVE